jgi:hypothetical protein
VSAVGAVRRAFPGAEPSEVAPGPLDIWVPGLAEALEHLTVSANEGKVRVDAPAGVMERFCPLLAANRDLLYAVALGRAGVHEHTKRRVRIPTTRHALVPCDTCAEPSMVGITKERLKGRSPWPRCRMHPGGLTPNHPTACSGRHVYKEVTT